MLKEFLDCRIQPLERISRDDLIRRWFGAIEAEKDVANRKAGELIGEIEKSEKSVKNLAPPLMITIFCLIKSKGGELPRYRAELYETAVEVILDEKNRSREDASEKILNEKWNEMRWRERLKRLMPIAYELHRRSRDENDDFAEQDLINKILGYFSDPYLDSTDDERERKARQEAELFIRVVSDQGGLLEKRGNRYGFYTHRTFREYLAGRYIAKEKHQEWEKLVRDYYADDNWREVLLLAAGFLSLDSDSQPYEFIEKIASINTSTALQLAVDALLDLPPKSR